MKVGRKKGFIPWNKGLTHEMDSRLAQPWLGKHPQHTEETKRKMSVSAIKRGSNRTGVKHSIETRKRLSEASKGQVSYWKGKKRPDISARKGELSNNWKGGRTSINQRIRSSLEYRLWRKAVFERDKYTCIWCYARSKKGKAVYLNADHIKPFAYYPELRFALDNGRTLCLDCHRITDTYGVNKNYV